jgi:hypothetical protein
MAVDIFKEGNWHGQNIKGLIVFPGHFKKTVFQTYPGEDWHSEKDQCTNTYKKAATGQSGSSR